jgi:hypothetical protein
MKWFSCIFALYIISLCAFPCQDNGEHSDFSISSVHIEKACDGHHDSNCSHKCSPFCFCNCCQVNTVVTVPVNLQKVITIAVVYNAVYVESQMPEFATQIWQPPKTS